MQLQNVSPPLTSPWGPIRVHLTNPPCLPEASFVSAQRGFSQKLMPLEYRWRKKKSLWWHFKDCGWHYSQSTDRFVFWVQMLQKEQMHLPLQTQCIQSGDRAFSRYWVEGCPGSVVCRFCVQREEYKDEAPWGFGERWLAFDHPSGVSDVAAVKNTGEAAALVCAKHISSKCLACSVAPHLNESFLRLIEHAAGSPVDTEDLDFFPHCFFWRGDN